MVWIVLDMENEEVLDGNDDPNNNTFTRKE